MSCMVEAIRAGDMMDLVVETAPAVAVLFQEEEPVSPSSEPVDVSGDRPAPLEPQSPAEHDAAGTPLVLSESVSDDDANLQAEERQRALCEERGRSRTPPRHGACDAALADSL